MKKEFGQKLLKVFVVLAMLFSTFTVSAKAENELNAASSTWEKVENIAAAAASGKSVAITMTASDGTVYALPAAKSSSAGPSAARAAKNNGVLTIADSEEAFGWTVASTGDGYTFTNGGNYLYVTAANNGVRVNTQPSVGHVWNLKDDYLTAVDSAGTTRYLGVYNGQDWRCYTSINNNIKNQTLEFWTIKESSGSDPDPVIAKLEKFTTAPENNSQLVIYYPADGVAMTATATGSKLAGVSATIEDGKLNQTEAMAYLTVVTDGNGYYQFKDVNGNYLTSGATGNALGFEAASGNYSLWALQQQSDGTWYITSVNASYNGNQQAIEYYSGFTTYGVRENDSRYKFDFYGVHGSGGSVDPEIYTVTVQAAEHGTVSVDKTEVADGGQVVITISPEEGYELDKLLVNNVETAVTNNKATVTAHSNLTIKATFKLSQEPVPTPGKKAYEQITDLADLQDGDQIVIVNLANNMALSQTYTGYYNSGEAVTISDNKVTNATDTMIWTVGVSDGTYTFSTADGQKLSMAATRTSMPLGDANDTWTISPAPTIADAFFIANVGRAGYTIEWYAQNNNWSAYNNTSNEALFAQKLYHVSEESETPVTGDTFGLASTIADGDEVILYNSSNKAALGNTLSGYKITGVTLVPEEGVITTDNSAVVWTVVKNANGTYSFTQGDKTLGGVASGSYNNLVVSDATAVKWTLTGPDSSDFNYFLSLDEMTSSHGNVYLEYYNGFTLYGSTAPDKDAFGITFYKKGAEPETPTGGGGETGNLVTDLSQLTDGTTVAIYSPGHKTAISSKPNGDWYLKANSANVVNGEVVDFTEDFVWTVKRNSDNTYSFYAYGDETRSITVWPSGNYAELSLNVATYPDNKWSLAKAKTANCWYISSPTVSSSNGPAYIEAYVRNEAEVFSGYFTNTSSNRFVENEFALQFYLIDPDDAIAAYDDGEWDHVLNDGEQYVIYNANAASSIGLFKEANYAFDAIPTTIEGDKAKPGNGAYVFTVDNRNNTMGRYYGFKANGKYLATNEEEELFFVDPNEDGTIPENAKWYLNPKSGNDTADPDHPVPVSGYIIYNKEVTYNGTPVCIEYYSSVFSGWTYSTKNNLAIYLFNFYKTTDDTNVYEDVVQDPSIVFDCADERYVEQDFIGRFTLDDLCPIIEDLRITYTVNGVTKEAPRVEFIGTSGRFTIPAEYLDADGLIDSFTITANVRNSYGLEYSDTKVITVLDEPFFEDLTPMPNYQTKDDKRPQISVKIGNAGENPTCSMLINGEEVDAVYENQILSWKSSEDMADGRVNVIVSVERQDGKTAGVSWAFTVGYSDYQLYFGQLHSHTTYSDGSGTLDTALEYIASIPEGYNVQFVAFTDHSNYFDTPSAANPADAMNDRSLMTDASRALWEEYKGKVAEFNETHDSIIAIAGYEMTWSGGPGHINSFNTDGLVSRNDAALNNKTNDAGMRLYYETMNKDTEYKTMHQFNHPGTTFGNFNDFSYWDEETDKHMFLVEVGNGEGQIGQGGYYPSYEEYILALDKGWHVAPTNNQDNHKGRWGNANDARDVVLADEFSEEGIYEAIKALRVYATEDKNLQINYQINGMPMGTVFSDEEAPTSLNVEVILYDPDATDSVRKVELVSDSGTVSYTWNDPQELKEGMLTAELDPDYSYYFVRVTQEDGDLAVTAPIWVGKALALGIESFTTAAEKVYASEDTLFTVKLFNNEDTAATVKSLVYLINGSEVIGTDSQAKTLAAGSTLTAEFTHAFDKAKLTEVTVKAVIEIDGKEYEYMAKIELDVLDKENENKVTSIAEVREASVVGDTGYRFVIEGIVTSNASGYDKDTAFFDCIYVQDETGGICVFPVSGDFKIGDKVHIVGHTDFYQGEPELQVEAIVKISENNEVAPIEVSAKQINDREAEGKLITVKGTVDSYEAVNGLIQTVMVKDSDGNVARVFIDGYITTAYDVVRLFEGNTVEATGLASYDDTWPDTEAYPRIRIRDRKDVVCDDYKIIEGADSSWTKDSEEEVLIVSNAPNDWFEGLYIDGELIDESSYGRVSGSTRVTLPAAYLQTLADSDHTVTIRSADGSATTSLKINAAGGNEDPINPDPIDPDPVKPDPEKPDPVKPDPTSPVPFRHPMTGIDTMRHFRPHIGGIRKY